jgi:hypothetical protein
VRPLARRSLPPRRLAIAAVALAAMAAGCGNEAPSAAKRPPPGYVDPTPAERIGDVVSRVQGAATASGCAAVKGLLHSMYGIPGESSCRSVKAELGAFQDPVGRAYGTGAVIDYSAVSGRPRLMGLALDSDRRFRVAFIEDATSPSIGTPRAPQADAAASAVVLSMQTGDCDTFLRYVDRRMGLGTGSDAQVCHRVSDDQFRRELVANRSARPVPLGGNSQVAFYKVRTAPARYYTMVMVRRPAGGPPGATTYVLVNAFPA